MVLQGLQGLQKKGKVHQCICLWGASERKLGQAYKSYRVIDKAFYSNLTKKDATNNQGERAEHPHTTEVGRQAGAECGG
jgi:hypothetical protein